MKTFLTLTGISLMTTLALSQKAPHPTPAGVSPFACDRLALSPEQRKRHFDELGPQLRTMAKDARELADGYEFEFPSNPPAFQMVTEWAAGEHACCPFFDIDLRLEREGGRFWLRLTG